jgi:hypothetical protein
MLTDFWVEVAELFSLELEEDFSGEWVAYFVELELQVSKELAKMVTEDCLGLVQVLLVELEEATKDFFFEKIFNFDVNFTYNVILNFFVNS